MKVRKLKPGGLQQYEKYLATRSPSQLRDLIKQETEKRRPEFAQVIRRYAHNQKINLSP